MAIDYETLRKKLNDEVANIMTLCTYVKGVTGLRIQLAQAALHFISIVDLTEQYENIVKNEFLSSYANPHVTDVDADVSTMLTNKDNFYLRIVRDEYIHAVTNIRDILTELERRDKLYDDSTIFTDTMAELLRDYMPWYINADGRLVVDYTKVFIRGKSGTITEFAKANGFYPSKDE